MDVSLKKNSQNLNSHYRSSSCSSPVRNQVVFQEIHFFGMNTLVRSYSCNSVFRREEFGRTYQATEIQISSFLREGTNYSGLMGYYDNYTKHKQKALTSSKATCAAIKENKGSKKVTSFRNKKMGKALNYLFLPLICACALFFFNVYIKCRCDWDAAGLKNKLQENVFGQNDALTKINSLLNIFNTTKKATTIVFTGGVGVGKTFSSSIISHYFQWNFYKLITYTTFFETDIENLLKDEFEICGCSLVVVDDLSIKNLDVTNKLKELLQKQKIAKLLILLIFTTHSEIEANTVVEELKKRYLDFHHVPFKSLNEETVRRCFAKEVENQKAVISEKELDKLIKNHLKKLNILNDIPGCKGVAEEVAHYYKKL